MRHRPRAASRTATRRRRLHAVYPWFNACCGDIDLIGSKKPQSYYRDVVWGNSKLEMAVQRPIPAGSERGTQHVGMVRRAAQLDLARAEGKPMKVRVFSTGDRVRLLLNGKQLGEARFPGKPSCGPNSRCPLFPAN